MNYIAFTSLLTVALFVGMVGCCSKLADGSVFAGSPMTPKGHRSVSAPFNGAVFALLGLLIAFTFSGAATRFDERRNLIVQETNDIGTAYLRLDLLPPIAQPRSRDLFRKYLDARLEYRKLPDMAAAKESLARSTKLQAESGIHRRSPPAG